jgi:iron complex transport system substrate-binding protein
MLRRHSTWRFKRLAAAIAFSSSLLANLPSTGFAGESYARADYRKTVTIKDELGREATLPVPTSSPSR